jgi:hypothetical protein
MERLSLKYAEWGMFIVDSKGVELSSGVSSLIIWFECELSDFPRKIVHRKLPDCVTSPNSVGTDRSIKYLIIEINLSIH